MLKYFLEKALETLKEIARAEGLPVEKEVWSYEEQK